MHARASTAARAATDTPSGPFEIIVDRVPGIWQGDGGTESDHFLFVDDDGSAYFTRYHSVQKLNATVYSPERGGHDGTACNQALENGNFWGPFLP